MAGALGQLMVVITASTELTVILKVTIIAALTLTALRLIPRAKASVRHGVLAAMFGTLLLLSLLGAALPARTFEIAVQGISPHGSESFGDLIFPQSAKFGDSVSGGTTASQLLGISGGPRISTIAIFRVIWAAGVVLSLIPVTVSLRRQRNARRHALPWLNGEALLRELGGEPGTRRVELMVGPALAAPLTCGSLRPAIFMPSDVDEWSDGDVRRAIAHELEHIRRHDGLIHLSARKDRPAPPQQSCRYFAAKAGTS